MTLNITQQVRSFGSWWAFPACPDLPRLSADWALAVIRSTLSDCGQHLRATGVTVTVCLPHLPISVPACCGR